MRAKKKINEENEKHARKKVCVKRVEDVVRMVTQSNRQKKKL